MANSIHHQSNGLLESLESVDISTMHPAIFEAEEMVAKSGIEHHRFFEIASRSRDVLKVWAGQELFITTPFSQCLLDICARIDNLHVRSMVAHVTWGEHSVVRNGTAANAHPWLLYQMALDLGIDVESLTMSKETDTFLTWLRSECSSSVLEGIAAIGVGSEQLIVPEYGAVKEAFAEAWPESGYERFLDANITEDVKHGPLMSQAANALIRDSHDATVYLEAARRSVDERIVYYDALAARCEGM